MDIETAKAFFFWCMVINSAVYALIVVALIPLRGFMVRIYRWQFDMDEKEMLRTVQRYLASFKLFITVFNFTPWIALLLIS